MVVLTYIAAQSPHKYGTAGSHGRAKTPLSTNELRHADHAMNYRQTAKTAAYWALGVDMMRGPSDRDSSVDDG